MPIVACQFEKSDVIGARSRTKCVKSAAMADSSPARTIVRMKIVMMQAPMAMSSHGVLPGNIPLMTTGVKTDR